MSATASDPQRQVHDQHGKVFENMETQLPASDPVTNAKVTCEAIRDPQE